MDIRHLFERVRSRMVSKNFNLNDIFFWWPSGDQQKGQVKGVVCLPMSAFQRKLNQERELFRKTFDVNVLTLSPNDLLEILRTMQTNVIRDSLFNDTVKLANLGFSASYAAKWFINCIERIEYRGDVVLLHVTATRNKGRLYFGNIFGYFRRKVEIARGKASIGISINDPSLASQLREIAMQTYPELQKLELVSYDMLLEGEMDIRGNVKTYSLVLKDRTNDKRVYKKAFEIQFKGKDFLPIKLSIKE